MRIDNKTILITGASSGIGRAAAIEAAGQGAQLILVARRKSELDRTAEEIQKISGKNPITITADITREADRKRIFQEVTGGAGKLEILVNNAGITAHGRFDESDPSVLRRIMEINFFAMAELTQILLPVIKKTSGEKMIVLVSTVSGLYGIPGRSAYSASKSAGHAVMESLRLELKEDRIHTLIFCPGYTQTGLRTSGLSTDGSVIKEEQASGAITAGQAAKMLWKAVERNDKISFTNSTGRVIYWLRTMAPGLLERLMLKKLKRDFQKKPV